MSKNSIVIKTQDGGAMGAYIVMPEILPAPVIIVIQEIFGVNAELRAKCDTLADEGYIAICPDLFWRIEPGIDLTDNVPEQLQRAFHLFSVFDVEQGVQDLQSTLSHALSMKDCTGKVGAVGYCLGGKLAFLMAIKTEIHAVVSYYGVGLGAMLDQAQNITEPLLLHIAGDDEYVPKDEQAKIIAAMEEHPTAQIYTYPGMDHAFARGGGMHYNLDAAHLANGRTERFLQEALKS
jgi:carboxymethylenebutenolidase